MRSGLIALLSAFVAVSASCSAMADMMAIGSDPKKALQDQAGPGTCCVNQQFFECPTGSAAFECLGDPVSMATCSDKCAISDDNCKLACVGEHAPNPSGCTRVAARDAECPPPK